LIIVQPKSGSLPVGIGRKRTSPTSANESNTDIRAHVRETADEPYRGPIELRWLDADDPKPGDRSSSGEMSWKE
jgi:hypothetical protein